jgi:TonB family protein
VSETPEVFSTDEMALAVGVPRDAIRRLIAAGDLRFVPGTSYIAATEAVQAGSRLRATPPHISLPETELFARRRDTLQGRDRALPAIFSSCAHTALLLLILWFTAGPTETAAIEASPEKARLVFLVSPGPGGGGGGGGQRNRLPAPRLERRGRQARVSVPQVTPAPVVTVRRDVETPVQPTVPAIEPKPAEKEPEPVPAEVVVAPVVTAQADPVDREGVIDRGREASNSRGPGADTGSGTGRGAGNGEGLGAGIGDGAGGGTGGGPYRPGSGIEPPRLVREVKADYTEEARHRGLSGDVVLEIVVRRDGTVGDVRVLQSLGAGLEQRAIAAVRQWRFDPARRKGVPVDVIVEVAVEFTLR